MTRKWIPPNVDNLVRDYENGVSVNQLSKELGVARHAIIRVLRERGIDARGHSSAEYSKWARMDPAQRQAQVAAAHEACRGRVVDAAEKALRANTRMLKCLHISAHEVALAHALDGIGVPFTAQAAIGPRNVDFTLDGTRIAVEVWGGCWHNFKRPKSRQQIEYLLDAGWTVLVVVVGPESDFRCLAEYVRAFAQAFGPNEATRGCYRVVGRDMKTLACPCYNLDGRPRI